MMNPSELARLEEDWDSYGAKPIDPRAIETAEKIKNNLQSTPSPDGGIQIEFATCGVDFEMDIAPDGQVEGILFYKESRRPSGLVNL